MDLDRRVPPDSFVYKEVARLYKIAHSLRPVATDRWNRELYETNLDTLGGLDPKTGVLRLSKHRVLMHLTGATSTERAADQAEALSTVLHEATHGGMHIKVVGEPNAVLTSHSRGVMEGFAEVRAVADFDAFADLAGYEGLTLGAPHYPGAFAATKDVMTHVTGPGYSMDNLIDDACRGPVLMHFDQFAHALVVNQLSDLTHREPRTQQAIRAQLIEPMLHAHWPTLPNTEAPTGHAVARDIRLALDARVDELRRRYDFSGLTDGGQPGVLTVDRSRILGAPAARTDGLDNMRFLGAQPSASGAVAHRPVLGQGARRPTTTSGLQNRPTQSRPRE
ncbi:hypothetical protein GCM10009630_47340 [Kribbella jejuensis]|uniref:Uncharacterized protein n=1 Tax=Kribbella jejuensis TaxID=236068 RepID=A0A542E705_9ACTN|nr:hypothetical protein [Kribbella jejuensis]TQJ11122.1 hypothetical protein FB475_4030 [Kribbella jejuensis]